MNSHALVPLIATIAYIPLIITLLINRPWDARRRLFVLFIIPAVLWSVCDVLFRSDYMMEQKLFLVRTGITMGVWMGVQYYYLLRSFYSSDLVKRPYVYVLLIIIIVLALAGYMPRGVEQVPGGLNVQYGFATLGVVGALFVLGGKAIWKVWQKRKYSQDPIERNQLSYLFVGVILLIIFTSTVFFPGGGEYPMAHYGNLLNAALLTYVIIRHRLMDVRIMMRRFLVTATVYVIGIACWLLIILAIENLVGIGISMTRIVIFLGVAIPLIAFFNTVIHPLWGRWVERAFMGESYKSRGQLFDFIQQIYDVPTLEQFGSQLVYLIARSVGASRDCLFLPQQDIEETDFHARFSYPPVEENPIVKLVMNNDNPLVVWLKKEQRILHRNYIETIPELQSLWQTERDSIQLAEISMFVPLINRDELVAVLAIGTRTDGKIYNVEDIDLIESIANRVAASMEKEYLYERLEYQERELRLINELIRMINSSMNIQNIFEGFIHELSELVEVDGASIAFREEEMARIVALSVPGRSQWNLDQVVPIKDTSLEQVFSNKEMYYEPDLTRNQKYKAQEKHLQAGARSIVYLPMVVKGETTGCLVMANRKTNAYSSRQLALLERLAVQIAIPIENMRLYATAEQRARIDELTMLFNRRHFDEQFKAEMSRHARYNQALSLLMIDLDSFKTYNDIFGHPSGDKLLREIGELINSSKPFGS